MSAIYGEAQQPPSLTEWQDILTESPQMQASPYDNVGRRHMHDALIRRGYHYEARTLISGKLVPILGRSYFPPKMASFSIFDADAAQRGIEIQPVTPLPETTGWFPASIGIDPMAALAPRARQKRDHFVATVPYGRCVVSPWGYAIFAQDGAYLTDFCCNDGPMIPWSGVAPDTIHLSGTVAVLTSSWSHAVHHWNMETLPRFKLLALAGVLDQVDYFIMRSVSPWHYEYLDRLGIPREKLVPCGLIANIQAERLLVCSNVEATDWTMNPPDLEAEPWVCQVLADLIPPPSPLPPPQERIYISRANAGSRRVMNEGELRAFLEKNGFRTVFFEELNLEEKANTMRNAAVVVSPIGAALTYIPFMQPGSRCVAFYSHDGCGSSFRDISANCGVIHIHGIFPSTSVFFPSQMIPVADHLRELLIDLRHLARILESADIPMPYKPDFESIRRRPPV